MNAFDTLSVFSSAHHSIVGYAMFGLVFHLTACWLSPVAMLSRQHEHGYYDVRAAKRY